MLKNIPLSGLTTAQSDYTAPDGELALALNLANDDGHLVPLSYPSAVMQLAQGERALFIHKTPSATNLITSEFDESLKIFYSPYSQGESTSGVRTEILLDLPDCHDITAIGNTLILATSAGLQYILWKNGSYIPLGNRPPFLPLEFTLFHVKNYGEENDITVPENCWTNTGNPDGTAFKKGTLHPDSLKTDYAAFTQSVYAILNSLVHENITSKGLFYQPFFIRYAFRLYDGSHSWHSAPVLLLPTVLPPMITYKSLVGNYTNSQPNVRLTPSVSAFRILYRNLLSDLDSLSRWSDIVTGVDFFVSAPIYTYDQSADIADRPERTRLSLIESLCSTRNTHEPETPADRFFVGNYGIASNYFGPQFLTRSAIYGDHIVNIPRPDSFYARIADTAIFYKIASVDLKDLPTGSSLGNSFKPLPLDQSDLTNLVTLPTLQDDYLSHARYIPSQMYSYNSRLLFAPERFFPPEPFPIRSLIPFDGNPALRDTNQQNHVEITVLSRYNNSRCYSVRRSELTEDFAQNLEDFLPSYIFVPDPNAYQIQISIFPPGSDDMGEAEHLYLKLTPHSLLNGAFYLNRSFVRRQDGQDTFDNVISTAGMPLSVPVISKILTSEASNPFIFPPSAVVSVGNGKILALASAARPLSQGQFGQFPLYAFTSEGVWALEVSPTGTFSARQPITRDICFPTSVTQIDSAVLFASDRGVMLLSGSQAQCISEPVNSEHPFDCNKLSALSDLVAQDNPSAPISLPYDLPTLRPFRQFIQNCSMIYDYSHQRIIIFNPSYRYSYIFSLRSRLWSLIDSDILYTIPSYPEALAISATSNTIVNFSRPQFQIQNSTFQIPHGLIITRPLKLDNPDSLKTIHNIIARGDFARPNVSLMLFASRDMINWNVVSSSKTATVRGFSGTPYKYFRIALLTRLAKNESISSVTVDYVERLTRTLH